MSKRNKQQTMYQPAGPAKKRTSAKSNIKTNAKRPQNSASNKAKARATSSTRPAAPQSKAANHPNLGVIRIAAIVIAVVAIIGGAAWASYIQTTHGSYTPLQVVGLIALGFVAGLAIAVALRTGDIVARVIQIRRERARR